MTQAEVTLHVLSLKGVGAKTCGLILDRLGHGELTSSELYDGLMALSQKIPRYKTSEESLDVAFRKAESILASSRREGIKLLSEREEKYPAALRMSSSRPPLLYCLGDPSALAGASCAIIGSRKAQEPSLKIARRAAMIVAEQGLTVVSGLALGIDAAAHQGCLDASGVTVAVMAGGLDRISPPSNRNLAEEILKKGGALVSEYPVGAPSIAPNFAKRNRIQAGLSGGVLLIQAARKSGSLITCDHAVDDGRALGVYRPAAGFGVDFEGNRIVAEREGVMMVSDPESFLEFCGRSRQTSTDLLAASSSMDSSNGIQGQLKF